jgi:hypothetical protein
MELVDDDVARHVRREAHEHLVDRHAATVDAPAELHAFAEAESLVYERLLRGMDTERAEDPRQAHHLRARIAKPEEEVPVERVAQVGVYAAPRGIPDPPPPEERLLRHVIGKRQRPLVVSRQDPEADLPVELVDQDAVSIDDVDVRMVDEVPCDVSERSRQEEVVRVQPRHDFAGRSAEAAVDRVGLTLVWFRAPAGEKRLEAA